MNDDTQTDDEDQRMIAHDTDDVADLEGLVYEQRGDRHLIQLHAGVTYEFEVEKDQVAAGLKGIGDQILSEMDSPLNEMALSPGASENDGDEEA